MATLNGTTPAATYPSLIKFDNNSAISAALRLLSDGSGNATPVWLSATQLNIGGLGTINSTLGVSGAGATAATTSLRIQNNGNTSSLDYNDAGTLTLTSGGSTIGVINNSGSNFYNIRSLGGFGSSRVELSGLMDIYDNNGVLGIRVNTAYTGIAQPSAIGQTTAPAAQAQLELVSTTRGFLPPRMTTAQRDAIATPPDGLLLYNTTSKTYQFRINGNWEEFGMQSNAITAATAAINTAETIVVQSPVLTAGRFMTSTIIRAEFSGTCTASVANTSTFRIRIGTAGTTADGIVFSVTTAASAAAGTNIAFSGEIDIIIRTIGASATAFGYLTLWNQGTTGIATTSTQVIQGTMTAFNSTTANFVSLTYQSAAATTTSTFQAATIEIID